MNRSLQTYETSPNPSEGGGFGFGLGFCERGVDVIKEKNSPKNHLK